MQDFRDKVKKTITNDRQAATLDFISEKFVIGYPCVSLHFILYLWTGYFALFSGYVVYIIKLLKFKIVCCQKLFRSLADIAVYFRQIKRRSAGKFILKSARGYFFV